MIFFNNNKLWKNLDNIRDSKYKRNKNNNYGMRYIREDVGGDEGEDFSEVLNCTSKQNLQILTTA